MSRIRSGLAAVLGLLLALTALVAPAVPAQAATAGGTVTVEPGQVISAKFTGTKLDKKRTVTLESSSDGATWTKKVETKKMSSKGAVTFGTVAVDGTYYRATANAFTYKSGKKKVTAAAVTTPAKQKAYTWNEEFDSLDLSRWSHRTAIGYAAKGRHCAAPVEGNTTLRDGIATLKVTEVKNAAKDEAIRIAKEYQAKEAGAAYNKAVEKVSKRKAELTKAEAKPNKSKAQKKSRDKAIKAAKKNLKSAETALNKLTPGCPNGVFANGMITAGGNFTVSKDTGKVTVVARVKFAKAQGAHGGIWLQDEKTRQEIDIIEAYGRGRGITNIVHRPKSGKLVKDPSVDKKGYVAVKSVASSSWWDKWHTVAVTFDSKKVTFYLDGVKTKELKGMTGSYSLIVSMLSSDWETQRMKKPDVRSGSGVKKSSLKKASLPMSMQVDWIRAWQG